METTNDATTRDDAIREYRRAVCEIAAERGFARDERELLSFANEIATRDDYDDAYVIGSLTRATNAIRTNEYEAGTSFYAFVNADDDDEIDA